MTSSLVKLATDAGRFSARCATRGGASLALGAQGNAAVTASGRGSAEAAGLKSTRRTLRDAKPSGNKAQRDSEHSGRVYVTENPLAACRKQRACRRKKCLSRPSPSGAAK